MPRILLVEDDADVRLIIEHTLIDAAHVVDAAGTMRAGLQRLGDRTHDLVIADAKLPDGTGMQVADRAAEYGIRAVIITGYAFTLPSELRQRYDILLKPLRPVEIVAAVERVLQYGIRNGGDYFREKAAQCRRLADAIGNRHDRVAVYLRGLADEFETRAAEMTATDPRRDTVPD